MKRSLKLGYSFIYLSKSGFVPVAKFFKSSSFEAVGSTLFLYVYVKTSVSGASDETSMFE